MFAISEITNKAMSAQPQFYRFEVYQGTRGADGYIHRSRTVGMAYLQSGQSTYTLRLWTFMNERFYLLQSKNEPTKYLLMTREPNKLATARSKYFWNIVGNARIDSVAGHMQINFDLLPGPIYMNLFPEPKAASSTMAAPESFGDLEKEAA